MKTPNQLYDASKEFIRHKVVKVVMYASISGLGFAKPVDVTLRRRLPDTVILPPDPSDPLYQKQQRALERAAYANLEAEMREYDRTAEILNERA